jgi:hypothetical protein
LDYSKVLEHPASPCTSPTLSKKHFSIKLFLEYR